MQFTLEQYDRAIEALQQAKKQLVENTQSKGCGVCGGACWPDHCGHNPLYAQYLCNVFSEQASALHDTLHKLSGFETRMGESVGIASVIDPTT